MPRTGTQKFVFLLMMAITMTLAMESYNLILNAGGIGMELLRPLLFDFPLMCVIVMAVQSLIGGPLARKLAFRVVTPGVDSRRKVIIFISTATVFIMCPVMSAIATLIFKLDRGPFPEIWLKTFLWNLPFAFAWQMLCAGPLVRFLFRRIYSAETVK